MKIIGLIIVYNERNDYKVIFCCIVDIYFRIEYFLFVILFDVILILL